MKKLCAMIFLALLIITGNAYAEVPDTILDEYAEFYGNKIDKELDGIEGVPEFSSDEIIRELNSGRLSLTPKAALEYMLKLLLGEVTKSARLLAVVLAMAVLCSYLSGLKEGFGGEAVANCAFYVCYIIIAGITASAFYDTALCAAETVRSIGFFMRIIVPLIIATLMTSGAVISATMLEPALLSMTEIAVWVTEAVFIPAVMVSAALNIVNGMSEKFKTDRMVKLIGSAVKWGLSLTITIFVSLAGIKSIASSGVDGLTLKLGKFATSNLIPVVGGILSESIETVMSCSVVIKNSIGLLGIISVILISLRPLVKIGAILILFRITAAIAEPVSDIKIVACISRLADSVSVLLSMVAAVTVMFILVLTIMINAGSNAFYLGG